MGRDIFEGKKGPG